MLHIQTPPNCGAERAYILGVLLADWLGIPFTLTQTTRENVSVRFADELGEITLPDTFFSQEPQTWLTAASLPGLPLASWDSRELANHILLTDPLVPVLYGELHPNEVQASILHLPIDIFGAAFFMLSRYEEAVIPDRDKHDRFPAIASLASRGSFLHRPIIDEYVEILWVAMRRLWPGIVRKQRNGRVWVTCDLDWPFFYTGNLMRGGRQFLGDLIKRQSPRLALSNWRGNWRLYQGDYSHDPYAQACEWIMDVNEALGNHVTFFVIPKNTHPVYDNPRPLNYRPMRILLRHITRRGHQIGIHPGYCTYNDSVAMAGSVTAFRRALEKDGLPYGDLGNRQHYLRFDIRITPQLWVDNDIIYDSTLGYPDVPGFRCGTCREYKMFNLFRRRKIAVTERPLVIMESSLLPNANADFSVLDEAVDSMKLYRKFCFMFGGAFTLLWHNSFLLGLSNYQSLYKRFVSEKDNF